MSNGNVVNITVLYSFFVLLNFVLSCIVNQTYLNSFLVVCQKNQKEGKTFSLGTIGIQFGLHVILIRNFA